MADNLLRRSLIVAAILALLSVASYQPFAAAEDPQPVVAAPAGWEYHVLGVSDLLGDRPIRQRHPAAAHDMHAVLQAESNRLGADGWELAATTDTAWIFKRPLP